MKKNCNNCTHGYWDVDYEDHYKQGEYFTCEGRDDDSVEFENNLAKPEYREKAKRCCKLRILTRG